MCLSLMWTARIFLLLPRKDRRKWFYHKFNGPGLKYEIATCIRAGEIVHFFGPFRAAIHDLTVFWHEEMPSMRREGIR
jgi:hypothetical protein